MTCSLAHRVTRFSKDLEDTRSTIIDLESRYQAKAKFKDYDVNQHLEIDLANKLLNVESRVVELESQQRLMQHKTVQACYQSVDNVQKEYSTKLKHMEQHIRLLTQKFNKFEEIVWKQKTRIQQLEGEVSLQQSLTPRLPIQQQLEDRQRVTATHSMKLSDHSLRLDLIDCKNTDGVLLWKINDMTRRRRDAVNCKTPSIYSQPFYTSPSGYKMCARMYLNGDGMGRRTHLSLFFVVMRGEFDALLDWPFRHEVTLTLIDQDNRRDINDAFRPDPMSSSFQRPSREMNVASGCPLFLPLTELDAGGYIKDDAMFVKIVVDCSNVVRPERR